MLLGNFYNGKYSLLYRHCVTTSTISIHVARVSFELGHVIWKKPGVIVTLKKSIISDLVMVDC